MREYQTRKMNHKAQEYHAPRVGSLYAGVGGIDLAFKHAGYTLGWANEIDSNACKTYRYNLNDLIEGDIRDIGDDELEPVDILCAGFPCQPFSIAGNRQGFSDIRGTEFFEVVRLIKGMNPKPQVVFLENVKGFRTHDNGNTFTTVKTTLEDLGYHVFDTILDTCVYTAIPQHRERTFIIGFSNEKHKRDFEGYYMEQATELTWPISYCLEVNKVPEKYYYREDKYNYPELVEAVISTDTVYQWRRRYVRENQSNMCPTLTANMGTGGHNVPLVKVADGIRKLTPQECFNFQGFPIDYTLPDIADSHLYKQAGNSVSIPVIRKLATAIIKTKE